MQQKMRSLWRWAFIIIIIILFAMIMTSEVRHESVWTRMFTLWSLVGAGSRFKRAWRSKGRKVSRTKTRYMYVNEREIVGKLSMQRGNVDAFLNVCGQPSKTTNIAQERRRKCRQSGTDGDKYRGDLWQTGDVQSSASWECSEVKNFN